MKKQEETFGREITVKDVARYCNVSIATVSRVINNTGRFSAETKEKVDRAIKELNYIPNVYAASMVTKKTKNIGIMVPNIINPFYSAVIQGVMDTLKDTGYHASIYVTEDSKEIEKELIHQYLYLYMDGLLLIGSNTDPDFYKNIKKEIVFIDRYIEHSGKDGVVIDNYTGTYELTQLLIQKKHRKIAMINGLIDYNDGRDRYAGYHGAMCDYDIEEKPDYYKGGEWTQEHGYIAFMELMELPEPPTAVVAGNNVICEGILYAMKKLGLKHGTDIYIAGFDETSLAEFAGFDIPQIRRPTSEMGVEATKLLLKRLKKSTGSRKKEEKIVLPVEIVHRNSI